MKRYIGLFTLALILLSACTRDEVKEVNRGKQIGFRTPAVTKGYETTSDNLKEFYATSLACFSNNEGWSFETYFKDVLFLDVVDYFVSNPAYYWPSGVDALCFYAYSPTLVSPAEMVCEVEEETPDVSIKSFTPSSKISEQQDLVVAFKYSTDQSDDDISFSHALSQIEVRAKNTNDNYVYNVKGIRIANVISSGDYSYVATSGNEWSLGDTKTTYEVTYDSVINLESSDVSIMAAQGDNAMIIPQERTSWNPSDTESKGGYLGVLVNIKTKDGSQVYPAAADEYDWVAVPFPSGKFDMGVKYTFYLDFSQGAGYVAPDLIDSENNTSGVKIGNEMSINMRLGDWTEKVTYTSSADELAGIWKAYRFIHREFEEKGACAEGDPYDEYEFDVEKEDLSEEEKASELEALKSCTHDFYYMEIPRQGGVIYPLNDDGTRKDGFAVVFNYENGYMHINGLDDGRTVPFVEKIETNPDNTDVRDVILKIDRTDTYDESDKHIQWLYFHVYPLNE